MARMVNWKPEAFMALCINVSMDRLEECGNLIAADAKQILQSQITGTPITRTNQKAEWMEREPGALVNTIRVVRKHDSTSRNIWVMAGNKKTWWALQTEFGHGGWKGGAKPFLRPAFKKAASTCQGVLEGDQGTIVGVLESGQGETA